MEAAYGLVWPGRSDCHPKRCQAITPWLQERRTGLFLREKQSDDCFGDAYRQYPVVDMFRGTIIRPGENKPPIKEIVKKNLDAITKNLEAFGVKDKVRGIAISNNEASGKFEGEYFDLVFIDAEHSYEGVKADLLNWYPKLKPGVFLFCDDCGVPEFPGVAQAIQTAGLQGLVVAPSLWGHTQPAAPAVNTEAMPEII